MEVFLHILQEKQLSSSNSHLKGAACLGEWMCLWISVVMGFLGSKTALTSGMFSPAWQAYVQRDPVSSRHLQAHCLNTWHTPRLRMHQILKQWEQPKHRITHSIVPSTAELIVVACGDVVESFCLSLQHFLWWISAFFLWLYFMSVLIGHALKHDEKYSTVPTSLSQGATSRPPWSQKALDAAPNSDASQVYTAVFVWILVILLQGRRSRHYHLHL